MGFIHSRFKLINLAISLIVLAAYLGNVHVQGRILLQQSGSTEWRKTRALILRSQIGSRPPRCEGRCFSCGRCEAIQVPTNPQMKNNLPVQVAINYARGSDDASNYKPMSWKCKCGNLIFSP